MVDFHSSGVRSPHPSMTTSDILRQIVTLPKITLLKFNSSPLKIGRPKRKGLSSNHHFSRGHVNFPGGVTYIEPENASVWLSSDDFTFQLGVFYCKFQVPCAASRATFILSPILIEI